MFKGNLMYIYTFGWFKLYKKQYTLKFLWEYTIESH